ncbi:MAG: hypothetical protein ACOY5Y_04740 [Pseudomonadota bacterium]|jgi:hypothetical protein
MTISPDDADRPAVNATRARQGGWGRPILWVLLIGTALAALGMFAALFWRAGVEGPPGPGQERVVAPSTVEAPLPPPPDRQAP